MKKQLTSMLLAGLISFPCLASSTNLESKVSYPEGYVVSLYQEIDPAITNSFTRITDTDSNLTIVDLGNDGLNDGDHLSLEHTFVSKEKLKFKITYRGNDHYFNEAKLYSPENKELAESELDTRKVNRVVYYFVKKMTQKSVDKTKNMYLDLLRDTLLGSTNNIPYKEIKEEFANFECSLPELKKSNKKFERGMIGLTKKYMGIINQKKASSYVDLLFSSNDSPSKNTKNDQNCDK